MAKVEDLQASPPEVAIGLSRAGVTGVQKAVRIGRGRREKLISATIDCAVDLDPSQKGVHMSRFPELFEEAIEGVVEDEAFLVEDLAEHVARRIVRRQGALLAEVRIQARYPYERHTPVTGLSTQEMVSLIGIAAASRHGVRRIVGVEAVGINACPCAQGLVRDHAGVRLREAGYDDGQVEEIFSLLPAATHNQRAEATLMLGTTREVDARDLIGIAERSMSAPIFELLKRPDELHVVEQAHLHPRFVEDSVRLMIAGALEHYSDLSDGCFVLARQINFETIHNHDVLAERHGVVSELRADLERTGATSRHTTADEWLLGG
jgi:GTP cyclohydrolase IV